MQYHDMYFTLCVYIQLTVGKEGGWLKLKVGRSFDPKIRK